MNQDEYTKAYEWLLSELQHRGASDLVREIEGVVRAGTIREQQTDEKRGRATFRQPLSPRERLIEGLRVILAAASVPLMLRDAASNMKTSSVRFLWRPDFLEDNVGKPDTNIEGDFELPEPASLDALAENANAVLSMISEIAE